MSVAFSDLALSTEALEVLAKLGFVKPTSIQAQILPYTLAGLDAIGQAQTGTGKTVAFLLTIFETLHKRPFGVNEQQFLGEPRALVLAPTRELAQQIYKDAEALSAGRFYNACLVGGNDIQKQQTALDKAPLDIVIGTPGRILDWVARGVLFLDRVEVLVLDEADRMLDMGFIPDIKKIVAQLPDNAHRQSLLFSATFNTDVMNLAYRWLYKPIFVEIVATQKTNTDIVQQMILLENSQKMRVLMQILADYSCKTIIFANRKDQVRRLAERLQKTLSHMHIVELSGDIAQNKRERNLQDFKQGKAQILVATDVAGRGIHVDDVDLVINYTLPDIPDDYVHRIGRTGRAGRSGVAISLIGEGDAFNVPELEKRLNQRFVLTQYGNQPLDGNSTL